MVGSFELNTCQMINWKRRNADSKQMSEWVTEEALIEPIVMAVFTSESDWLIYFYIVLLECFESYICN